MKKEFKGKEWKEVKAMLEEMGKEYVEEIASDEEKAMYGAEDCIEVPDFGESGIALWFEDGVCYSIVRLDWA